MSSDSLSSTASAFNALQEQCAHFFSTASVQLARLDRLQQTVEMIQAQQQEMRVNQQEILRVLRSMQTAQEANSQPRSLQGDVGSSRSDTAAQAAPLSVLASAIPASRHVDGRPSTLTRIGLQIASAEAAKDVEAVMSSEGLIAELVTTLNHDTFTDFDTMLEIIREYTIPAGFTVNRVVKAARPGMWRIKLESGIPHLFAL